MFQSGLVGRLRLPSGSLFFGGTTQIEFFAGFGLPILGLPYYLLKSRGFRAGMAAIGGAVLVAIGSILLSVAGAILVAWIRMQTGCDLTIRSSRRCFAAAALAESHRADWPDLGV